MPGLRPWMRHALLASGLVLAGVAPGLSTAGTDFGLTGILFPVTIVLAARGGPAYWPWLLGYAFTLNATLPRPSGEPWWWGALIDWVFILLGSCVTVALSARLAGRRRFLPRYALHVFYPGHLGVLGALRALV